MRTPSKLDMILTLILGTFTATSLNPTPTAASMIECKQEAQETIWLSKVVDSHGGQDTECVIAKLTGAIKNNDGERISDTLRREFRYLLYLELDSPGGNLTSAMKIGRTIREMNILTFSMENQLCASACFFIWIGGPWRTAAHDSIRVHRFRSFDRSFKNMSAEELEKYYKKYGKLVSSYIKAMEVRQYSNELTDMMLHVPPERSIAITQQRYPDLFETFVPSRDQWLRNNCGSQYMAGKKPKKCAVRKIFYERFDQ